MPSEAYLALLAYMKTLDSKISFRQVAAFLPRWILACKTAFSSFLARTFSAQPSGLGPSSAVFPIPLAHFGLFKGSGPHLSKTKWWTLCRRRLLHILVVALNYVRTGFRHIDFAELGRAPSATHRAIYGRLRACIAASDTPEEFPLPPGRAGPEFIARLFDLEEFARAQGFFDTDHYQDTLSQPRKIGEIKKIDFEDSNGFTPFEPYRSLNASRLKLSGDGKWPIHDFIHSELWLPYLEPKVLEIANRPDAVGPNFDFESYDECLALAKIWDLRGLTCFFFDKPRFRCRVFNAHKSALVDRQIGDRRWANQHELHPRGLSTFLPNGPLICSLHCPRGHTLRGCISDRKDFYHQCAASRDRAFTNCIPFDFPVKAFNERPAISELAEILAAPTSRSVHGDRYGMSKRKQVRLKDEDRVICGFRSLLQGDHLGVEYALEGHQNLLKDHGLLCDDVQLLRHRPFPSGGEWQGLVIDDFFSISAERIGTPVESTRSAAALQAAEAAYSAVGVFGSDEKTVRGAETFKVIGAEVKSDLRTRSAGQVTVGAPLAKRLGLSALTLRVARLPVISKEVASRLCGSWVSTLMFRRPMSCLLQKTFSLGSKVANDGNEALSLPRGFAEEFVLSATLSILCCTDVSVKYAQKLYATDASLNRGAVTSFHIPEELNKTLWLSGDKKGCYTKPDNEAKTLLRGLGHDDEDPGHDVPPCYEAPSHGLDFDFDFVEICGGSGVVSEQAARLGLKVCTPIDLSKSPHFDLRSIDLLWWILGVIRSGRFRSVCCEPPCNTFSPAQHPASRSYSQPLGFDRLDARTLLGNILAFRCLIICWCSSIYHRPSLLEQPHLSKMAWLSAWQFLLRLGFEEAVLASCAFGSKHRKQFRFLLHGLDRDFLDVRCPGGHAHIRIEGVFTKASGVYVEGVAERIAAAFRDALASQDLQADERPSVSGLESVVLNDILSLKGWEVEQSYSWRYPSHINVFESYSLVSLMRQLVQEGGDQRFVVCSIAE